MRYTHFGEGDYEKTEAAIRSLLAEAGSKRLGGPTRAKVETADPNMQTPETYLGSQRAEAFLPEPPVPGTRVYPGFADELPPSHFALKGVWSVTGEFATSRRGASLSVRGFWRPAVFLVLGTQDGRPRRVRVLLDGRPIQASLAGKDVRGGVVTVRGQRLYRLVSLPRVERRSLTLRFDSGVTGYAFTFG